MQIRKIRPVKGPEAKIQADIIKFLEDRKWYVLNTHGNMYQRGFPDLYACRRRYKYGVPTEGVYYADAPLVRWIEVKNPESYSFTPAQLECFPKLMAEGAGVWVMLGATEIEYAKLFQPPNWVSYLSVAKP